MSAFLTNLRARLEALFARADEHTGGSISVLRLAVARFGAVRGSQAAAGLSYYAFFSLFPLLLFILLAAGRLLDRVKVYDELFRVLGQVLPDPFGQEVVGRTIEYVLPRAGSLQLLAALGLLWSGTGFFSALVFNIDLAWPEVEAANPVRRRLYGLLMVGILILLLLTSLSLNLVLEVLWRVEPLLPVGRALFEKALWPTVTRVLIEIAAILVLFGLYWAVPKVKVRWEAAVWGALVAALTWRLLSWGFSWLVAAGLTRYETVYGPLGAVVGLLFWLYLSSWIVLFGAHLTSAIDRGAQR